MKKSFIFTLVVFLSFSMNLFADSDDNYGSGSSRTSITLTTKSGLLNIKPIYGTYQRVAVPFFGYRCFVRYSDGMRQNRINDGIPALTVNLDDNPHEIYWLVRLKPWEDDSSMVLDLHSPSVWESTESSKEPDSESIIAYNAIENKPGEWRITPKMALPNGNYGLFRWARNNTTSSYLYAFSVTDSAPSKTLNQTETPVTSNGNTHSKTPRKMTADVKNNPKYDRYKGIILNDGKFVEGSIIGINNQIVSIRTNDDQIKKYHFVNDVQKFVDR